MNESIIFYDFLAHLYQIKQQMSWRYIITFNTCSPDGATMLYTFFAVLHFCVHFPLNFFLP